MEISRVLIAHNVQSSGSADDPSASDVMAQVEVVAAGLAALGVPHRIVPVPEWRPWGVIDADPGTVVFNLMEAPPGRPEALLGAASALELLGLPFTGSAAGALWVTTDKIATRAMLAAVGLPVAPGGRLDPDRPDLLDHVPGPWILKPACEDASLGMEGDPVCATPEAAVSRARELARRFPGQAVVAETFLPGRELNVSLLAGDDGNVEVLPVAEMVYEGFPAGMSRVLGYEAKWREDSFAYIHTVRRFLAPAGSAEDGALIARAGELARDAWRIFGLRGYVRVDLRLDTDGEPRILEVNANPCLAANGGFMAAAKRAGHSVADVVRRILADAVPGRAQAPPTPAAKRFPGLEVRRSLTPADRAPLEALIRATGFFNPEEITVALELVDDRLTEGEASHYRFLVGERDGRVAGYACWGAIPGTLAAADLYWIVVHPDFQGQGAGAALLRAAEEWIAAESCARIYVETSTRPQYQPTRAFYLACGYRLVSELVDFYGPGDGKATFLKVLELD